MATLALIAARAANGVIGRDNDLPWRLAGDLRRFKALTMGKPMIMGRRTFESIGRALPGRITVVVTRSPTWTARDVLVARNIDEAVAIAERVALERGVDEIIVAGGAQVYAALLPRAGRIYLTEVDAEVDGDTRFPALDPRQWREIAVEEPEAEPGDTCGYRFRLLERRYDTD